MKIIRKLSFFLLLILFLLPTMSFGTASNTPSYVGIGSNYKEYYIYNTVFDKDPYEDFLKDAGYSEAEIENITDSMFDDEFDEEIVEWRVYIEEIKEEKDLRINSDKVGYVKYTYDLFTEDENGAFGYHGTKKGTIYEYDKDLYVFLVWYENGLFSLFVAKDVNWKRVARNVDEDWGEDWDGDDEKGSAEVETSWYYFTERANGISTCWNPDEDDFEDFETISKYNEDGVLLYYEWTYDGDTIWKFELRYRYADEYWWVFITIAIAATVVLLILTFTVIERKKLMMIVLMGCVFFVIFLIISQALIIYLSYYFGTWS